MRTIETFSRARGLKFPIGKSFRRGRFKHRRGAGDRADCMRARARDLPVRLGRLEAPKASEDSFVGQ